MNQNALSRKFEYHGLSSAKVDILKVAHEACWEVAEYLNVVLPEGAEKENAVMKLEEALLWVKASIERA